jgi:hypothetical protein
MTDPRLDRIPSQPDPIRQIRFAMAPLVQGLRPRSYTWRLPFVLDQGSEGACVAHGVTHEAVARPVTVDFGLHVLPTWATRARRVDAMLDATPQRIAQAFAFDLYDWCRRNDEWPGENYSGTSAAAGAKGAVDAGLWGEYRWTTSADEFAIWVSRNGPGCFAVDWYTGMFSPDRNGFLNLTGRIEGGHMIVANGFSIKRDAFKLTNSWGPDWGDRGVAWLRRTDAQRLASQNGEMLGPVLRLK